MNGEIYLKHYNSGLTYTEIGTKFGVARGTIATGIRRYRHKHGLKPKPRQPLNKPKKVGIRDFDKKQKKERIDKISQCERNEEGVLMCPPVYSYGYGFDAKEVAGWLL